MAEFRMPSLGADMETGTVTEWLVKPGDTIAKGDPIAVIDTDKATIEVESFHTGVVTELLIGLDERVPVGTVLAVITDTQPAEPGARRPSPAARKMAPPASTGEASPTAPEPSAAGEGAPAMTPLIRRLAAERHIDPASVHGTGPGGRVTRADIERAGPVPAPPAPLPPSAVVPPTSGEPPARVKASPLARRLAAELAVDLAAITGTGRTGAIRAQDVRQAAEARSAHEALVPGATRPAAPGTTAAPPSADAHAAGRRRAAEKASGRDDTRRLAMRQAIARAMSRSKREIPHYYLTSTTDMSAALTWLRERNRQLPVPERILPAALLLKAAACAAAEVPQLNGFWLDDAFVPGEAVHLGVAISLKGGGLIAPALHDTADRDLPDLMAAMKDLVSRARTGRLRGAEMTEATITVTNLGDQGVESVHGVIYPPQVALVGFGKILERPWAVGGLLGVRPLVTVTLAADHRATDGYTGGRLLAAIDRLLNHPEEL